MTDHPKEARLRGESLGACLEGKREKAFMLWQERVLRWTNLPLSGKGECHTPLVVGKYAQTKQRRLKGKVVKTGHGRYYKRTLAVP